MHADDELAGQRVLDVQDGGGSSLGSAQLDCAAGSGSPGGPDINIVETTIPIMGQQGNTAFSFGTITTTTTGQLGSATISSLDSTMKLSYCGLSTCTWPPQPLMPSYSLQVECVPGTTQTMGTLTVFEAGGSATDSAMVTCTGSGGSPMLAVSPGSLAFSTQQANTTSAPQQIHISNTGGSQLDNVLIDFGTSVNASQWQASACTSQTGACRFATGSGSDVDITFAPTGIGAKDVTLDVTSSNGGSDTVSLTGTGTGGIMSVQTPSAPNYILDIGTIPRGQPFSRDIVLANTGNALYTATTSTPSAPYTIATGPFTVLGGGATNITVTCESATATTTDNPQTITITSTDAFSGGNASVGVRCKIADTLVQVSPMSFDYGEVRINTLPEPVKPITLTNPSTSAADAQVTGFTLRNNSPGLRLARSERDGRRRLRTKAGTLGAWIVEPRVGFTKQLAAKEEQALTVSFEPPARGRYEAELTVSTQAGKQIIHLVGDASGRDWQNTSFYACACNGPGAPQRGWPVLFAVIFVSVRRRRGSSSAR